MNFSHFCIICIQERDVLLVAIVTTKKDGFCLADRPNSYRHEFKSNSDWLKFESHSYTGNEDYLHQDPSISLAQYDELMMSLERVVGKMSLDLFPRIHKFEASEEFIRLISNHTLYPIKGMLAADDTKNNN